jgi:hypothetical protein
VQVRGVTKEKPIYKRILYLASSAETLAAALAFFPQDALLGRPRMDV